MKGKDILVKIGKRIQLLRKSQKLSQETLAEFTGMHPTHISDIERAIVNTSILSLYKIAKALNLTLSEMLNISSIKDEKKDLILQKIFILLREQSINSLTHIEKVIIEIIEFTKK